MKKTNFIKTVLLLCALIVGSGSVWADYEVFYTLECVKNSKCSAYDATADVTINGMNWNAPGNQNLDGGWRIGGKNLSNPVDRVITGKSQMGSAISKVTFNHKGKSRAAVTVPSVTLTVASDAAFENVIDEVEVENPDITKDVVASFNFTPTSPLTEWTTNSYYKITINVGNSDSSNGGLNVTSIVFYKTVADKTATETEISATGLINTDLKDGTAAGSLSASVTAGGSAVAGASVTWDSEDPTVATIDEDGVVTLVGTGTTTITATYAGDDDYYGSSDTYELTVTDTRVATVTTIDATGLTNTDIHTSTVGGTLTASVTVNSTPVFGATVTWESSNTAVATIDASGNVTLVKVGNTTITASYAGSGIYAASSATYELTVTDSNAPLLNESVSLYTSGSDSSTKITNDNKETYLDEPAKWNGASFTNAYAGKYGCFKLGTSNNTGQIVTNSISLTGSAKLTFQARQYKDGENGVTVSVTGATAKGDLSVTAGEDYAEYSVYLNNATGSVVITLASTSRIYLDEIKLVKIEKENVTVSDAGYATFVSDYDLDYSGLGVKAYRATVSGTAITFEKVITVPAGEGVLLDGAGNFQVPVATGVDAWDEDDNVFVRGTGAAVATEVDGKYNYILNKVNDEVGFYKANGQTVATNRAYLQTTTEQARIALFFDDDETTGINAMLMNNERMNNEVYNLNGQRVAQPTKGLYIVNGKKVVIK